MKYVMVVLDGAVDHPLKVLEDRTPLMAAAGEHFKAMAKRARIGVVQTLPPDWEGDPEAALLGLLGYEPREHFTGRGPLDAAALEIDLDRQSVAFRLHLVPMDGDLLLDATVGELAKEEGRTLARHLQETLRIRAMQFYPAEGYRHVLVWRDGPDDLRCTSPYTAAGQSLRDHLPTGDRAEKLIGVMWDSAEVLADHPINRRRRDAGKPAANLVWPWSPGRPPRLPGFGALHGIGGACIAGNAMVRGLARLAGLQVVDVPGATGSLDTDYRMKARAALTALETYNFVLVHIESPNEASLQGDPEAKVDALRRIDERFFGTLLDRIGVLDDFRILVVPDHATYVEERRAGPGWVPFMLTGSRERPQTTGILPFDERALDEADWRLEEGRQLLAQLFG
jgi:2,3-bisphosphoglycerate-independent phosphoglycerate mutase